VVFDQAPWVGLYRVENRSGNSGVSGWASDNKKASLRWLIHASPGSDQPRNVAADILLIN